MKYLKLNFNPDYLSQIDLNGLKNSIYLLNNLLLNVDKLKEFEKVQVPDIYKVNSGNLIELRPLVGLCSNAMLEDIFHAKLYNMYTLSYHAYTSFKTALFEKFPDVHYYEGKVCLSYPLGDEKEYVHNAQMYKTQYNNPRRVELANFILGHLEDLLKEINHGSNHGR